MAQQPLLVVDVDEPLSDMSALAARLEHVGAWTCTPTYPTGSRR